MAQTIRRNAAPARRQARSQGNRTKVRKARAKTNSLVDALMRFLPFTEEQLHKAFLVLILAGAAAAAWAIASAAGLTALAGTQLAYAAADAGYEVERVEVRGVERMNELKVYERVLGQQDRAMPLVDLHALRASLMELSWVEDARVSRQLPDTIVVDIVERKPHAALRRPDRLVLIDHAGHELEPISETEAKALLRISGPGAQAQVQALSALLDAAPALKPQVTEAEWVGNRRWNLTYKTGQVLALPQGEERAAAALMDFARADGLYRLIGGKVVAFDMRNAPRIYMRCPECREEERARLAAAEGT
jgi:cell division protein FtsQ